MRNYKAGDVVTLDVEIPAHYYGDTEYIIYPQEIVLEDNKDEEEEFLVLKAKVKVNCSDYPVTIYFSRHGRCGLSSDFHDNPYVLNQTV
jgi:hypothetical protein